MFVEYHIIQSFAPSNLNRDDTNNPKDCTFGGVRRARISSQCFKRAIRLEPVFAQTTGLDPAMRTRLLAANFNDVLLNEGETEGIARAVALRLAEAITGKLDKDNKRTSVLIYISQQEAAALLQLARANWEAVVAAAVQEEPDKKVFEEIVKEFIKQNKDRSSAPDIAMFGRMLAEKPELNIDAACQVAHAISTHKVSMEMDFFTAVDDLLPQEETGSAMMGLIGFNSATFYRYARLGWNQLLINLKGNVTLARRTVEGFMRAMVRAIPTGKQNTFAAHTPPVFMLAVVRQDGQSWSLANAFERPVYARPDTGLVRASVDALDTHWGNLVRVYGGDLLALSALTLEPDLPLETLADYRVDNLEAWIGNTLAALPQEYGS